MNELVSSGTSAMVLSGDSMQAAINFAAMMSNGVSTLPKHLQGNQSDCLAVTMQAMQWGMSPFAVAQKTHVVSGTLGYEAQLVNAVISSSTAIDGRFHYEYGGDWGNNDGKSKDAQRFVKVGAKLRGEDEIQWGEPLYPASVTTKNSPLWKTNEKQQSSYLALKYWSRLYCPAVMLGVYTTDELMDRPPEKEINPAGQESALRRPSQDPDSVTKGAETIDHEEQLPAMTLDEALGSLKSAKDMNQLTDAITTISNSGAFKDGTDDYAEIKTLYQNNKANFLRDQDAAGDK